tara:strand:+ start:11910 stop:13340 length:1431 start_codon:yes stop_codon:yes gene_type:complete
MKKRTLRVKDKITSQPTRLVSKDLVRNRGGLVERDSKTGAIQKEIRVVNQQIGMPLQAYGEDFNSVGITSYGDLAFKENGKIEFSDGTTLGSSGNIGQGTITGVTAGNGITGGGNSGAVTVTVEAADSTISIASGGISVVESNLSSIPNSSLSNSTISGVSLGSNLSDLTIGNGVELNSGTTFNGSAARTLAVEADGSTISVGSGGISVASVPNSLTIGNGLALNSGTTYNGSAAVTLSIDTSDSTISVSNGGISVSESNLSGIPNASLSNDSVTVTAGSGMSGGGSCDLGASVTLTNAGVTNLTGGQGISVNSSTGNVTVSQTGLYLNMFTDSTVTFVASGATTGTLTFATAAVANTSVATYNNGTFSLAAIGSYRVNVQAALEVTDSSRDNTQLLLKVTNGSNATQSIVSESKTATAAGSIWTINEAIISYDHDTTRTLQVIINTSAPAQQDILRSGTQVGLRPYATITIEKIA